MHIIRLTLFATFASVMLNASTLTFNPYFTTEGAPSDFSLKLVFSDEVKDLPDAIRATVTLTPGNYIGDIVALYVDLTSSVTPLPATVRAISDAITGTDITARAINTSNVQAGNVGRRFSIGLAIGSTGIGNNKGDFQTTQFSFNTPGLTLAHISAIGVRVTSVGELNGSRNLSRKMFGEGGVLEHESARVNAVPEPGTYALLASGLLAFVTLRRRIKS